MAWLNDKVILQFYDQSGWELLAGFWSGRNTHFSPPFLRGICGAELLAVWMRNVHPASILRFLPCLWQGSKLSLVPCSPLIWSTMVEQDDHGGPGGSCC